MYFDGQQRLCSMLPSWTSLAEIDAFSAAAAGRCWFRLDDLLDLRAFIDALQGSDGA